MFAPSLQFPAPLCLIEAAPLIAVQSMNKTSPVGRVLMASDTLRVLTTAEKRK